MDAKPARRKTKVSYVVGTIAEVAEFFALSNAAVNAWRRDANPMPGSPGRFDLSKIAQWRDARRKEGGGVGEELKAADIRLKTAQARAKEMENSVNEGELVPLADVELFVATACVEFREVIMTLPDSLASSSPPELRNFVREESDRLCRGALVSLHRRLEDRQSITTEVEAE